MGPSSCICVSDTHHEVLAACDWQSFLIGVLLCFLVFYFMMGEILIKD